MLQIKNLSKSFNSYGQVNQIFRNLNLEIKDREIVAILGPSGCGKSTLLHLIAGLDFADGGEIILDNQLIQRPTKDIGLVTQDYSLFPWLTIKKNIQFALHLNQNISADQLDYKCDEMLDLIGLGEYAEYLPKDVSGGMRQRVAIGRTLAAEPKLILMDEPFSALDSGNKVKMQEFLTRIWQQKMISIVFVTHDLREANYLADRVLCYTKFKFIS